MLQAHRLCGQLCIWPGLAGPRVFTGRTCARPALVALVGPADHLHHELAAWVALLEEAQPCVLEAHILITSSADAEADKLAHPAARVLRAAAIHIEETEWHCCFQAVWSAEVRVTRLLLQVASASGVGRNSYETTITRPATAQVWYLLVVYLLQNASKCSSAGTVPCRKCALCQQQQALNRELLIVVRTIAEDFIAFMYTIPQGVLCVGWHMYASACLHLAIRFCSETSRQPERPKPRRSTIAESA